MNCAENFFSYDESQKIALCDSKFSFTYAEFKDRVARLAQALISSNVNSGDIVAVLSINSGFCIEIMMACFQIGAVYTTLNTRLSPRIVSELIDDVSPKVLFVGDSIFSNFKDVLKDQDIFMVGAKSNLDNLGTSYDEFIASAYPTSFIFEAKDTHPAVIFFTSGTTGKPKSVLLSHGAIASRVDIDKGILNIDEHTVFLCVLPLFHVTLVSAISTLCFGGTVAIGTNCHAEEIVDGINKFKATLIGLVPFSLRLLYEYLIQSGKKIPTLKKILYGGAPISPSLLKNCKKILDVEFIQGYGMTETASAITYLTPQDHQTEELLLTVGRAAEGMEINIWDENSISCQDGQEGEIVVKTPTIMSCYLNNPQKTESVFRDGWYLTGDIGVKDRQGYIKVLGRKDSMFITGGENVYPLEITNCILSMGSPVRDVCVLGIPDESWGQIIGAIIAVDEGANLDEKDVQKFVKEQLGGYKKPRVIVFTTGDLPRNAAGKFDKKVALEILTKKHEDQGE